MHDMQKLFAETVAAGLKRRSLTTCSRWAEACRVMGQPYPGPWSFKWHPWLRDMHDSEKELNVGQKSAQMGYTETMMNIVFYNMDIKGVSCLYVLPNEHPDASDFSAARFNPALESSEHLRQMFVNDVNNVGHKKSGNANLYIRGSRSRSQLKSIPTGLIMLDELDEMEQKNIPLAMERAAGQVEKQVWMISTPTFDNYGINKYFIHSSQNHFFFKCPGCRKYIELKFPESLVITGDDLNDPKIKNSHLICTECQKVLDHQNKTEWLASGVWEESFAGRDSAGWHISQLYSTTMPPESIAKAVFLAQIDPSAEQELWNSKLGLPHVVDGARVTDDDIEKCKRTHKRSDARGGGLITMGVDVGKWLHYEIDQWFLPPSGSDFDVNINAKAKVLTHGKVRNFEDLDELMVEFGINFCVVDINPERRKAMEFANRWYNFVKLCEYTRGISGKTLHLDSNEPIVKVDRTSWLDLSLGRFRRANHDSIMLPCDVDMEYKSHVKALVRIYEKDADGNPVGRYFKGNDEDHYAHARNYAEIALTLAVRAGSSHDITSVL